MDPGHWKPHQSVFIVSAILALTLFGDSLLYSVLPLYAAQLGIPLAWVGVLLSLNRWVRLLTNPLAAKVYQRFGLPRPFSAAVAASAAATFTYAQGWGLPMFLAARVLWGLCWSHLRLGNFLVIVGSNPHAIGLGMGVYHAVTRLGSAFTVVVGGALVDKLGYRPGLTIMAALTLLGLPLLIVLFRRLPHSRVGLDNAAQQTPASQGAPLPEPEFPLWFCYVGGFTASLVGAGILQSTLSLILQSRLGDAPVFFGVTVGIATVSGILFAIRWTSNLVVSPLVGRLSDLWGRRWVLLGFFAATMLLQTVFAACSSAAGTIVTAIVLFLCGNSLELLFEAATGDNAAQGNTAAAMSVFSSFYDFGAAAGPIFAYAVGTAVSFTGPYYIGSALMAILLIAYLVHWRSRERGSKLRPGP